MKLVLILLLCGCAVRGENGKFLLHESEGRDGTVCKSYLGKRVVLKCSF